MSDERKGAACYRWEAVGTVWEPNEAAAWLAVSAALADVPRLLAGGTLDCVNVFRQGGPVSEPVSSEHRWHFGWQPPRPELPPGHVWVDYDEANRRYWQDPREGIPVRRELWERYVAARAEVDAVEAIIEGRDAEE